MKIHKISRLILLSLFLIGSYAANALSYKFDGTVGTFSTNLVGTGFAATNDLSATLQAKIDLVASKPTGGTINISGNVLLSQVKLKSNVHININKGTVIKVPLTSPTPLFDLGVDASTKIMNVKVFCLGSDKSKPITDISQKYTIDVSNYPRETNFRAFMLGNVENFWISDMYVKDNNTNFSCITLNPVVRQTSTNNTIHPGLRTYNVIAAPKKGDIRNIYGTTLHNGYGVVQVQCADGVNFENLSGVGGVTLRLESGSSVQYVGTNNSQTYGVIKNIRATKLYDKNGFACVTLSPHGRINQNVDLDGIYSNSCCFAVHISSGFFDKELYATNAAGNDYLVDQAKFKKGYFAGPITIKNVEATYGINAIGRKGEYDYVEKTIQAVKPWENLTAYFTDVLYKIIPSAASVGYLSIPNATAVPNRVEGEYTVSIVGPVTSSGFKPVLTSKYGNILYEDDKNKVQVTAPQSIKQSLSTTNEDDISPINSIKVYPIPASDFVNINSPLGSKVEIFDYFGKMLKSFVTSSLGATSVDVSSYPKGIYVVHIYVGDKDNIVKLIKK